MLIICCNIELEIETPTFLFPFLGFLNVLPSLHCTILYFHLQNLGMRVLYYTFFEMVFRYFIVGFSIFSIFISRMSLLTVFWPLSTPLWNFCSARVEFCGYSIPHPSDARVNIRVQTSGNSHPVYYFLQLSQFHNATEFLCGYVYYDFKIWICQLKANFDVCGQSLVCNLCLKYGCEAKNPTLIIY